MRFVLRLIGVIAGLSVLQTIWFVAHFGGRGLRALMATGTFGAVTAAGWLLTVVVGPVAAVQLFRLRRSGRIAGVVLFGCMLLYYAVGVIAVREPATPIAPIIGMSVGLIVLVAILLSPAAKRACQESLGDSSAAADRGQESS